ncbi:cell wall synthesis KRE9KNH1 [Ascoidea rubescens DSM 1968]|uniref:Cell wall synthesis KRE9KNH1 n=1 Tax=Ascoidea rubescens DSM 1968 TaxID=1344418 RepID=A0A1D2VSB6_9ASCO|nr:cell wall synthesis KRE9KNH1 [Ascoidea rubescens DSM 1968]ODV64489.1 cell wall synthesis KRE9KNH1 [Ascoidea rubescens DSM 1968]
MNRITYYSIFLQCLIIFSAIHCFGDIDILTPTAAQSYEVDEDGYTQVKVTWEESGESPYLSEFEYYTFSLCTGPNDDVVALSVLDYYITVSGTSYTANIPSTVGTDGAYFIQVYGILADDNGYTVHYSNRFTLTGMNGTTESSGSVDDTAPSPLSSTLSSVKGTKTTSSSSSSLSSSLSSSFTDDPLTTMNATASLTVPYLLQTGSYRFAPMQTQPGSVVTASTWSRKFPTSAVSYFSTIYPSPLVYSTITPDWSYSRNSFYNYATAQPYPSENGGWYAAADKLQKPIRIFSTASSQNKRDWLDVDEE